jgi:hypothetical protein
LDSKGSTALNLRLDGPWAGAPTLAATASAPARSRAARALSDVAKTSKSTMSPAASSGMRADKAIETIHRTTESGP